MEVKINREIRNYTEAMFFGLSLRQFIFSACACVAVSYTHLDVYKRQVLCRRFPKRSRKPLKPIGRPFTGSRRNPRSRKRGERNGATKGTPADRGALRHAR